MEKEGFDSARFGLAMCLLTLGGAAQAELRCDCSQIIDTCSANVSFASADINIESSSKACSRVDYLIDGQPYTALVVDGAAAFSWEGQPQSSPQIVVENCRVCADATTGNGGSASAATAGSEANDAADTSGSDDSSRALVKVLPEYPRSALARGIEGRVTVEFDVTQEGIVQNIRVLESSNIVFVDASIDAVSRFRYPVNSSRQVQEQFSFRLLNGVTPSVTAATP